MLYTISHFKDHDHPQGYQKKRFSRKRHCLLPLSRCKNILLLFLDGLDDSVTEGQIIIYHIERMKIKIICLLYWLLIIPYLFQVIYSSYWNLEKNWFTQIETEACSICIYASHEWMERKLYERQTKLSCQFACRSCDFVSLQITSRYQRSCQKLFFNNKCNLQSRHPKLLR